MSYNIIKWETIRLENLVLPMVFKEELLRWRKNNRVTVRLGEDGGVYGDVKDDMLHVYKVGFDGEGSGSDFNSLVDLLGEHKFSGHLDALIIWEDGDISRLTAVDGQVEHDVTSVVAMIQELQRLYGLNKGLPPATSASPKSEPE